MTKKPFRLTALEPSEIDLHQSAAELLDWLIVPPAFYTTFPAGWGELPKSTAARLQRCGLKPGMPDILVFDAFAVIANRTYPKVVGIELKARKGRVRPQQENMRFVLSKLGINVYICRDLDEIIEVLKRENVPLRQRWVDHGKTQNEQSATSSGATESP